MMCMDVYDVCEGGAWLLKGGEKVERCCMQTRPRERWQRQRA